MKSRFTEKSENVLKRAVALAEDFGHTYVGTEHLLLSIAGEEGTYSGVILAKHKITSDILKKSIIEYSGLGTKSALSSRDMTPRCKKVIEEAGAVAEKHGSLKIGTEHLLYALLDERDSVAGRLSVKCGANIASIKEDVIGYIRLTQRELLRGEATRELNIPQLTKYGRNMTKLAKEGAFDPLIGRNREIDRIIRILCRKKKNNPCLIGAAGVGKTAIVEGLAARISEGTVPSSIKDRVIVSVDLSAMVAGAKYRGDFEERIKNIMDEAAKNRSVILFIDEIHTIVGAGSAEGAIDASNIMKPELARGDIQLIGATTLAEYRKYIEKDAALERRFQPIIVEEPTKEDALSILRGSRSRYEEHHGIIIDDSALTASLELSCKYFPDRNLPDKAIDLLDEACAMASIGNIYLPSDTSLPIPLGSSDTGVVTKDTVISVTEEILGYKIGYAARSLHDIEQNLKSRIIGQENAIEALVRAVKRSGTGLNGNDRPLGIFMFIGSSGVGKTELARALAEEMYGKEDSLVRYDMSEYSEPHSTSKLIGSAPGYVGYDDGTPAFEQIRRRSNSVILFDEIEKAHPDVHSLLLQIFDNGIITDSTGKKISFKNSYIIMTSNAMSTSGYESRAIGFANDKARTRSHASLKGHFKDELINRIDDVIFFDELGIDELEAIAKNKLCALTKKLSRLGVSLNVEDEVAKYLASEAYLPRLGARPLNRLISSEIESKIADLIINENISDGDALHIRMSDGKPAAERRTQALLH